MQCKPDDMALPNIVVLFFESWRYDMLTDSVTPNALALSQKSLVCSRHFCSGNSTVAGLFGFFYGLHATYWTAVKANNSVIHNPVLVDVLEENGYDFGIFARSNFERHKVKDAVFRGIDVHESFAGNSKVEQDLDMTQQLIGFLREQQNSTSPFFAFAFYKSNHAPYWYREIDTLFRPAGDQNLMRANDETDPTFYLNDYKNSTRYVDELIGQVLRELDSLGYMSNTIIIVTTDHGEQFNDDQSNYWGHGTNFTQWQTRVPMIFYAPDKEPRQIEHATAHVDIVPTILEEFFGCTNNARDYSNGVNLFADSVPSRPFVVGSYINHAFIIEDNVYEIYPVYTKEYKLDNIREKASPPPRHMLTVLVDEISRFYADTNTSDQIEPTIAMDDEKGHQ
jgi:membrane-anchored protein YejM (alkaline phosphatase superfamily)